MFNSCKDYLSFVEAKGFYEIENRNVFKYSKNLLEKTGELLIHPIAYPLEKGFENMKNPAVLTALTMAAIAVVTIAFYPKQFFAFMRKVAPILFRIQPDVIKFGVYSCLQMAISGLGIRTLGRLSNKELMQQWVSRKIAVIHFGIKL